MHIYDDTQHTNKRQDSISPNTYKEREKTRKTACKHLQSGKKTTNNHTKHFPPTHTYSLAHSHKQTFTHDAKRTTARGKHCFSKHDTIVWKTHTSKLHWPQKTRPQSLPYQPADPNAGNICSKLTESSLWKRKAPNCSVQALACITKAESHTELCQPSILLQMLFFCFC